ncbi:MAG: DCC1-like thiol-disulfide oxidoreductase family protein [Acidimicrobiales bacterium]
MAQAIVEGGQGAELGLVGLTVLYDDRCPLCRRLRDWLGGQPTLAPVEFVAADSTAAHRRFPALDHRRTTGVLTVVGSDGAVYEAERAWLVCGWLLPAWQPITERFASGLRLRLASIGARAVDGYRHRRLPGRRPCPTCAA